MLKTDFESEIMLFSLLRRRELESSIADDLSGKTTVWGQNEEGLWGENVEFNVESVVVEWA